MTAIRRVSPRSTDSQSILQHSYFIAAAVILLILVILRLAVLRRRNQTYSDFFRARSSARYPYDPYPTNDSVYGSMYHGLQLAPLPAAYRPDRRIHATDIDAGGRRLDPTGENWDGKDALPAYDNLDKPPKYAEASWTHGEPSLPMERSPVTPSQGEHAQIGHSNTTDGASVDGVDHLLDHTHTTISVSPETEALPPPIHHNSSHS